MNIFLPFINKIFIIISLITYSGFSHAENKVEGVATNWGIDLQNPVSVVAKDVYDMHFFVLIIITLITFILVFLSGNIYAYMRLTALKRNSYRSHNKYADIFKNRYRRKRE